MEDDAREQFIPVFSSFALRRKAEWSGAERVRACLLKRGSERERGGFVWQGIGKVEEEEVGS